MQDSVWAIVVEMKPLLQAYLRTFCTRNPATIPIVVGNEAAQTPSRFNVFSSMFSATTNGGAHFEKGK